MRAYSVTLAVLAMCLIGAPLLASAQTTDGSDCINKGTALLPVCGSAIQALGAQRGRNVDTSSQGDVLKAAKEALNSGQVDTLLADFNPTPQCCAAACDFNAAGCTCNANVRQAIQAALGADEGTMRKVADSVGNKCSCPVKC